MVFPPLTLIVEPTINVRGGSTNYRTPGIPFNNTCKLSFSPILGLPLVLGLFSFLCSFATLKNLLKD